MKSVLQSGFALVFSALLIFTAPGTTTWADANATPKQTYDQNLPLWGTTWTPVAGAANGYHPSFYTGFAIRAEFPDRIHIRLSRGNQTRVTVILDDQTISNYLFDLVKRDEFYKKLTGANGISKSLVNLVSDKPGKAFPHLQYFNQVIESPIYGIKDFVHLTKSSSTSDEMIYAKGLSTLRALNPGRIFILRLNLTESFNRWKLQIQKTLAGNSPSTYFKSHPSDTMIALDTLLWGRINSTDKPTTELMAQLETTAQLALENADQEFLASALKLFKLVTGNKYNFQVLNQNNQFQSPIQCADLQNCFLSYPEFTTIYPTGSVMETTKDSVGNMINAFTTPGLWKFINYSGRDVDNIRDEPFYGWIPKMDYEAIGNGFHNPGVRMGGMNKAVHASMNIPATHNTLWAVKRGGVSHGCSRLSSGHAWELRHILPIENTKMTQVYYFGNDPKDFDLFDIDGSGTLKVMGVEYLISYDLQGKDDIARREGTDLQVNEGKKLEFYTNLYGAKAVFTQNTSGDYIFTNPSISQQSYLDFKNKKILARLTLPGDYRLYEQTYEKDKIQLYTPTMAPLSESISPELRNFIRLMGRVRGCAPKADKAQCGETAFDQEAQQFVR